MPIKIKTEIISDDDDDANECNEYSNNNNFASDSNALEDSGIQSEVISQIVSELEQHGNIVAKEFRISIVPIKLDSIWSNFKFPLKTPNQLELLESFLSLNNEFRSEFIRNFSFVPEVSSRSRFGIAFAISEALFEPRLLQQYSWTGVSRVSRKLEFKRFYEIIRAFHEIVSGHDIMYTENVTKEFIINILLVSWKRY